jgi:hypothetical protein
MTTIDDIEELRAELRHCLFSAAERREAEANLAELLRVRDEINRVNDVVLSTRKPG